MVSTNIPEYTVSELSTTVKQTIESAFGYLRISGELSGVKRAASGHLYFKLKDEVAVIDAICWRGMTGQLSFEPEDGIAVSCLGKLTTYAGRSTYQLIVEKMEPAGAGALMALLEKRKVAFKKEGLFDATHKQSLPYLPEIIGIITSPTGAVIRDMIHRIKDRCPRKILFWPVQVQGEKAAKEIADAVLGFNHPDFPFKKPDLLIIARGGGSIEDLWSFNEEVVVRSVFASTIPVISAIGHDTDTTLIDYVADKAAPTPSAAAEMAVPLLIELQLSIQEWESRMHRAITRHIEANHHQIKASAACLPDITFILSHHSQRLDHLINQLAQYMHQVITQLNERIASLTLQLKSPKETVASDESTLAQLCLRLHHKMTTILEQHNLHLLNKTLSANRLLQQITAKSQQLQDYKSRLDQAITHLLNDYQHHLSSQTSLLESYHYKKVLDRGYALIWDQQDNIITKTTDTKSAQPLAIEFQDGKIQVTTGSKPKKLKNLPPITQGSLL